MKLKHVGLLLVITFLLIGVPESRLPAQLQQRRPSTPAGTTTIPAWRINTSENPLQNIMPYST